VEIISSTKEIKGRADANKKIVIWVYLLQITIHGTAAAFAKADSKLSVASTKLFLLLM
jgi:hypothetical protein